MTSITRAARGGQARPTRPVRGRLLGPPEIASAMFAGCGGGGDLGATCEGRPSMHDDAHLVAPSRAISEWISCHLARGARAHGCERCCDGCCSMTMCFFAGETYLRVNIV